MRRIRSLSAAERALWSEVARKVRPLEPGRAEGLDPPAEPLPPPSPPALEQAPEPERKARPKASPPQPGPLDRTLRRKISRGGQPIEARLDLHGLTQDVAHHRLHAFIGRAQADGLTVVLVITGKGAGPGTGPIHGPERGVLRRMVPHWLSLPDLSRMVVGFEEAGPRHGGSGALYVRLRKRSGPA